MEKKQKMIVTYNGMYTPYIYFDWVSFLVFELITLAVEFGILHLILSNYVQNWNWKDSLLIAFAMNLFSAFIAMPIWSLYEVGNPVQIDERTFAMIPLILIIIAVVVYIFSRRKDKK